MNPRPPSQQIKGPFDPALAGRVLAVVAIMSIAVVARGGDAIIASGRNSKSSPAVSNSPKARPSMSRAMSTSPISRTIAS